MGERGGTAAPPPAGRLQCPGCGRRYEGQRRFCGDCGLPLVLGEDHEPLVEPLSERHERIRKIKPQLTEGPLVGVAVARNQTEGEFIQGLLLEEGVPSLLRRTAGFDVPDFLAAGPRDVVVPGSAVGTAREVLLQAELIDDPDGLSPGPGGVAPMRLLSGLLLALALGALVVWLLSLAAS